MLAQWWRRPRRRMERSRLSVEPLGVTLTRSDGMRRAAQGAILGFLALLGDEAHRKELTRRPDKAAKDAEAGRERLCTDAMMHAQTPLD